MRGQYRCAFVVLEFTSNANSRLRAPRLNLSLFRLILERLARSSRHHYARRKASVLEVRAANFSPYSAFFDV